MKFASSIVFAVLAVLLLATVGCAQGRPLAQPATTDFLCWSPDLMPGAAMWREETQKRFPGAVVLVTHGAVVWNHDRSDHWVIDADPDELARFLKQAFPGRTIMLAACNPRSDAMHVAGVFYAKDIVWTPPDGFGLVPRDRVKEPGVGSIWDFVEGKP